MIEFSTWTDMKAFIDGRTLEFVNIQDVDANNFYYIRALNGPFVVSYDLRKNGGSDQVDYETNYRPSANKQIIAPSSLTGGRPGYSYQADKLTIAVDPAGGDGQSFDYDLSTTQIGLTGGTLYMDGNSSCRWSPRITMVDTLGIMGNGPNYTIQQFIISGGVAPGQQTIAKDRDDVYVDTPFPGLVLRIEMFYTGGGAPSQFSYGWIVLDRSIKVS